MDEDGSRIGAAVSEEAQCAGPRARAPFLVTLEDMLRKVLDRGISLHTGPFSSERKLESGGGSYTGEF